MRIETGRYYTCANGIRHTNRSSTSVRDHPTGNHAGSLYSQRRYVFSNLVEDILKFIVMVAVRRLKREVEHGVQTYVIAVLIIRSFPQRDGFVVRDVVQTVEGILHIQIGLIAIAVVGGCQQTIRTSAFRLPPAVIRHIEFQISGRFDRLQFPIIIEAVI